MIGRRIAVLLALCLFFWLLLAIIAESIRGAHRFPRDWLDGALCLYRHERDPDQGWATNTGNGYYGGLQLDLDFQRTYGTWLLRNRGTADRWTSTQQLLVAHRAFRGWKRYEARGWHPWPRTARICGLL